MSSDSSSSQSNDPSSATSTRGRQVFSKIRNLLGLRVKNSLKESLEEVLEEHENGEEVVDSDERTMLRNVLAFSELSVEDVMIPRADIVGVEQNTNFEGLKEIMLKTPHTRFPIYKTTMDNVSGFLHIKDLVPILCNGDEFSIRKLIRPILFVPPSMRASDLLLRMQVSHLHMAIVVDEYGGSCGLVTLEDLVEEIVGEIEDEHDITENTDIVRLNKDLYETSARVDIKAIEQRLSVKLSHPDDEFDTLGGLIFDMLGHVPTIGEIAKHKSGIEFEIVDADPRHIKRVIIRLSKIDNKDKTSHPVESKHQSVDAG